MAAEEETSIQVETPLLSRNPQNCVRNDANSMVEASTSMFDFEDSPISLIESLDNGTRFSFGLAGMVFEGRYIFFSAICILWALYFAAFFGWVVYYCAFQLKSYRDIFEGHMFLAVSIQLLSLIRVSLWNIHRLRHRNRTYVSTLAKQAVNYFWVVTILTILSSCIPIPYFQSSVIAEKLVLISVECLVLGMNGLLMFVDVVSVLNITKQLNARLQEDHEVVMTDIVAAREEINLILKHCDTPVTWLMATALLNVLAAFAAYILLDLTDAIQLSLVYLLKEVVFAALGFYVAALANESSDKFVKSLGHEVARQAAVLRGKGVSGFDCPQGKYLNLIGVMQNVQSDPLKFPVLGMVLTRKDVGVQFGLWIFGIVITIAARVQP